LSYATPIANVRRAAINASTVFAVILAILAGLIFAWVFKVAFLDRKPQPKPAEEARIPLTVAAFNIQDKTLVSQAMVKVIRLTQQEYDQRLQKFNFGKNALLNGNKPVGRTTVMPIEAEEPMFEQQFEKNLYPEPVSLRLAPGKQSVLIEVPANTTMVQVYDYVDVLCSISNDTTAFGPAGSSATAILAKNRKVIARFHTTATAGRPPSGPVWPYTLEVEPWQASAIELARSIGGKFSLSPSARETTTTGDALSLASATAGPAASDQVYKTLETRYAETNRFTVADLAYLFGVEEPEPENIWRLEKMIGNQTLGNLEYKLPPMPKPAKDDKSGKGGVKPAGGVETKPRASTGTGTRTVASAAGGNLGFKPIADPGECKNCAKKQ